MKKILFVILCCLMLMGCSVGSYSDGNQESSGETVEEMQPGEAAAAGDAMRRYSTAYFETEKIITRCMEEEGKYHFHGGYLYGLDAAYNTKIEALDLATNEKRTVMTRADLFYESDEEREGEPELEDVEGRFFLACDVKRDGGFWVLFERFQKKGGGTLGYVLAEFDSAGGIQSSTEVEADKFFGNPNTYNLCMKADGEGNFLVFSNENFFEGSESKYLMFSKTGKKISEFTLEDGASIHTFALSADGSLYLHQYTRTPGMPKKEVKRVNFGQGTLDGIELGNVNPDGIGSVCGKNGLEQYGDCILLYDTEYVYGFSASSQVLTPLAKWAMVDILGAEVKQVSMYDDTLYALSVGVNYTSGKGEYAVMTPIEGNAADKQVVKLAVLTDNALTSRLVRDYNRSQDQYQVDIILYAKPNAEGRYDFEEPAKRLVMDMLIEGTIDMVDLKYFYGSKLGPSWEDFLGKGYVEDLYPYLDRSTKVGRDGIQEKILEMFSCENGIPAIPTTFSLDIGMVNREVFGDRFGWTLDEFIAYDRTHPEEYPMNGWNSDKIYQCIIVPNLKYFVDFEKGETSFDSEAFRNVMEYAASYQKTEYTDQPWFYSSWIASPELMQFNPLRVFKGQGCFIGFPSVDGAPLVTMSFDSDGVMPAICCNSKVKEGAWGFVEYVLSQNPVADMQYPRTYGGILANKKFYEAELDYLASEDGPLNRIKQFGINGVFFDTHPFTKEEREFLGTLIDSASVNDSDMFAMKDIVSEEVQPYFAGQKSLDETIRLIENRVRLYMQENK